MRSSRQIVLILPIAAACIAGPALATNGYFSHGYGIKSIGMAGAGIALPQDALAAAINPAGMAMIGNRFDVGLNWFHPMREAQLVGSPVPFNGTVYEVNESSDFFTPEFGYNRAVSANMTLGVSVYGNGGMNTDYDKAFPLFGSTRPGVDMSQLFIAPTLGYKITPEHAVGVSLNLAYQRFKAHGLENFTAPSGPMQFSAYPADVTNKNLHTRVERRTKGRTSRRRHLLGAQRGNTGGSEKPETGDVALESDEGEAARRARSLGGKLVTSVGILGVG